MKLLLLFLLPLFLSLLPIPFRFFPILFLLGHGCLHRKSCHLDVPWCLITDMEQAEDWLLVVELAEYLYGFLSLMGFETDLLIL